MLKDALLRTANWLEANPDKHIIGHCAETAGGITADVGDPAACCFCAVGRLAKELGVGLDRISPFEEVQEVLTDEGLDIECATIYGVNDASWGRRGNPRVIILLRKLAENLE